MTEAKSFQYWYRLRYISCYPVIDRSSLQVIMSLRLLCKQTSKRPSNALFYFPEEQKTGIAPTRIIDEKDLDLTPGMVVTVTWDREKIEAEILALDGKLKFIIICRILTQSVLLLIAEERNVVGRTIWHEKQNKTERIRHNVGLNSYELYR